ncbi:MAG: SBBP repeat-containing protein [Promethearchaeota archaeon]
MMKKEWLLAIGFIILIALIGQGINPITSEKLDLDDLGYSTLFGGSAIDIGTAVTQDSQGNIIIVGLTYSTDFPVTPGAFDETHNGGADVFVSKFSPDGSSLIFSTYIGGSADELHYYSIDHWDSKIAVAVDSADNIIVHGPTHSTDFPVTPGAYDETYNGALVDGENHTGDMFVLKLAKDGSDLLFSTYLGGSDAEGNAHSLAVDKSDNIYLSGWTRSIDFPTTSDALNTTHNGKWDAFISILAANGSLLLYSTYFGGSNFEVYMNILLDSENNIYICGETYSLDLPITPNAFDSVGKSVGDYNCDGFIAKISMDGSELLYSSYISGSDPDTIFDMAVDDSGKMYLAGFTLSSDLEITSNAYDMTFNSLGETDDGILMKIAPSGDLLYSTFLGGSDIDVIEKILLDNEGNIYLMGVSQSTNFPTTSNAYSTTHRGNFDFIITKMPSDGSCILYSTYIGGSGYEPTLWQGRGWRNIPDLLLLSENSVVIVGTTDSTDYPVTNNALNKTLNGQSDVCISQLELTDLPIPTSTEETSTSTISLPTTTRVEGISTSDSKTTNQVNSSFLFPFLLTIGMIIIVQRKRK